MQKANILIIVLIFKNNSIYSVLMGQETAQGTQPKVMPWLGSLTLPVGAT